MARIIREKHRYETGGRAANSRARLVDGGIGLQGGKVEKNQSCADLCRSTHEPPKLTGVNKKTCGVLKKLESVYGTMKMGIRQVSHPETGRAKPPLFIYIYL